MYDPDYYDEKTDEHGKFLLSDFNVSKELDPTNNKASMTVLPGTPGFVAPELWKGIYGPYIRRRGEKESYKDGVDAIQVLLGCSVGKGNLLFHMTGKQAFSFYDRVSDKSVRLVLKEKPQGMSREESFAYYQRLRPKHMFDVKEPRITLPEKAAIFDSYPCECCGENTAANWIRIQNGKKLCIDCAQEYDRFHV